MATPDAAFEPQALLEQLPLIRALARRLLEDPADADDVAQDAVVAALEQDDPRVIGWPWLAGATRNLARLLFRREGRRTMRQRAASIREILPSAADESVRFEALRRVVAALDRLGAGERALLVRRFYDEWPPRRIAAELGVPVETARTRIARALANLRRELIAREERKHPVDLRALLMPLLASPPASSLVPIAPIVAGGLFVSSKLKLGFAVALAVAASVCIATWSSDGARRAAANGGADGGARVDPAAAAVAAAAESTASRSKTTLAPPNGTPPAAARARRVALRGRLLAEPGALARWTTKLDVVAAVEIATRGQVAARPAAQRLQRSIAVESDGTFSADLTLDGEAPRISRLTLRGADPAFAPFERRFAVSSGTADLAWSVEAHLFETAVVRGHVVDEAGQPIPDGAVGAFALRGENAEPLGETLVDADGGFALGVNASGPCTIVATQRRRDENAEPIDRTKRAVPSLLPATEPATPVVGREVDVGDLVLRSGASIRGRVEWYAHGPLAGAIVSARPFVRTTPPTDEHDVPAGSAYAIARLIRPVELPSGRLASMSVTTDERGEFEFTGLPAGPTRVRMATFPGGMMCAGFQHELAKEIDAPADGVVLRFDGALVEFAVASRGQPVAGAMVNIGSPGAAWRATWNNEFAAGPEGLCEGVIPPGIEAHWWADAWGFKNATAPFRSPASGDRVRIPIELEPVISKPSFVVHLVDEAGAPVTTAGFQWERVGIAEAEAATRSRLERSMGGAEPCAPDGRFILSDIAPDTYRLQVRPGGSFRAGDGCFAEIVRDVTIRADQVDEIELVAIAAGRLRVASRDVHGRFLPARVQVFDENGVEIDVMPVFRTESDSGEWAGDSFHSGKLATEGFSQVDPPLAPGRYTASFTLAGYAPNTVAFEIRALQPFDLEAVLEALR